MKLMYLTLVLVIGFNVTANSQIKSNSFIRVFDLNGKKIAKGKIVSTDASSLTLRQRNSEKVVGYEDIGSIKLKRSTGRDVIIGAGLGATAGLIFGLDDDEGSLTPDAALVPGLAVMGTLLGGIYGLAKQKKRIKIDGDLKRWEAFIAMIETEE
jgi:hypothetical protein